MRDSGRDKEIAKGIERETAKDTNTDRGEAGTLDMKVNNFNQISVYNAFVAINNVFWLALAMYTADVA